MGSREPCYVTGRCIILFRLFGLYLWICSVRHTDVTLIQKFWKGQDFFRLVGRYFNKPGLLTGREAKNDNNLIQNHRKLRSFYAALKNYRKKVFIACGRHQFPVLLSFESIVFILLIIIIKKCGYNVTYSMVLHSSMGIVTYHLHS